MTEQPLRPINTTNILITRYISFPFNGGTPMIGGLLVERAVARAAQSYSYISNITILRKNLRSKSKSGLAPDGSLRSIWRRAGPQPTLPTGFSTPARRCSILGPQGASDGRLRVDGRR